MRAISINEYNKCFKYMDYVKKIIDSSLTLPFCEIKDNFLYVSNNHLYYRIIVDDNVDFQNGIYRIVKNKKKNFFWLKRREDSQQKI